MKKYFLLTTLIFGFLTFSSFYQQNKINNNLQNGERTIDSLLTYLKTDKPDTNQLLHLFKLSREYNNIGEHDSALLYANLALKLSNVMLTEVTGLTIHQAIQKYEANSHNYIGMVYYDKGNYSEALKSYFLCLKIRKLINDKKGVAASYNNIGSAYLELGNYSEALKYLNFCLKIMEAIGDKKGIANTRNNIGNVYENQGNYPEALKNLMVALEIHQKTGENRGIAFSYHSIGNVYNEQGNYPSALKNYFACLKIMEALGNKQGIAASYGNIGSVYENQSNYPEALKYLVEALKIYEFLNDKKSIAHSYNNIGAVYTDQLNYSLALENYFASLKIYQEVEDPQGIARCYNNIGVIYRGQGNYPEALKNYFAALTLWKAIGEKAGMANTYNNIGITLTIQKKYKEAKGYLIKAKELSINFGFKEWLRDAYLGLTNLDSTIGNFKGAYENHKLFILYRDSLDNEETRKKTIQSQMTYDFEKKEAMTKAKTDKQTAMAMAESKKQKIVIFAVIGGLLSVIIILVVVYRSLQVTKKQKQIIGLQKDEVMRQKEIVEKEKKRSDELLLNILPSETAEELKLTGHTEPKQFDMVTVLFTDFKGFTTIAEKMTAKELVTELHYCFENFDKIISKYPIEKIKTIGDAYMCAGGLPVSNATNPLDVVLAGLDIQKFILNHKEQRIKEGKIPFEIRIGIHTGTIVAGIVGIKKFAYDIWGDTVNTASRMESSGETGRVNISGDTYKLLQTNFKKQTSNFTFTQRGMIKAKNKGEIEMYFVDKESV